MNEAIYLVILLLLGFVLFFKVKIAPKGEFHGDSLGLEVSKGLQGVAAVCIILHHLSQTLPDSKLLSGFVDIGVLFVGIFFFFSGYGLIKSLRSKDNYLKGFLKKRLLIVLIPTYVCLIVYLIVDIVVRGNFSFERLLFTLLGFNLINGHMWYIIEIVILYVTFYLIFKYIKKEKMAYALMAIFIIFLMTISLLLGHGNGWFKGEWWYNATFLFWIGMIVSRFSDPIRMKLKKPRNYYLVTGGFIALSIIFGFITHFVLHKYGYWTETNKNMHYDDKLLTLICQLPMIIFFVLSMALISLKIKCSNVMMKFLGKISLEVYLIHGLFLQYFRIKGLFIKSDGLYALIVLVGALILGFGLHYLSQLLLRLINKKKGYKKSFSSSIDKAIRDSNYDEERTKVSKAAFPINYRVRELENEERHLVKEFTYYAIYVPKGMARPSRDVLETEELMVYWKAFGKRENDSCLVADYNGKIIGLVMVRLMNDYGHLDDETPSLMISVLPEYHSKGVGTDLLEKMLRLLKRRYQSVSLSVWKGNYAFEMYSKAGFVIEKETEKEYIMRCVLK